MGLAHNPQLLVPSQQLRGITYPPGTSCSPDWIRRRVLAHICFSPSDVSCEKYFPAEPPASRWDEGSYSTIQTSGNTRVPRHTCDPPGYPIIPVTLQCHHPIGYLHPTPPPPRPSPNLTRGTDRQINSGLGHSWAQVETVCSGDKECGPRTGGDTHARHPQPCLLSLESPTQLKPRPAAQAAGRVAALRAHPQLFSIPGKVLQCLKKQNPQHFSVAK